MSHVTTEVGTVVVIIHDADAATPKPYRARFKAAWVETESPWDAFSVHGDRLGPQGPSTRLLGRFSARVASWYVERGAEPTAVDVARAADTPIYTPGHALGRRVEPQSTALTVSFDHHVRFILHGWGRVNDSLFGGVALLDGDETLGPATLRAALVDDGAALCMTFARAGLCQCRALLLTPIATDPPTELP